MKSIRKIILNIILIIGIIIIAGCDKVVNDFQPVHSIDDYKNTLTIQELALQLNMDTLTCFDQFPSQGKVFTIKGFIYKGNVFQQDNRFLLYSEIDSSLVPTYASSTGYSFKGKILNCRISSEYLSIYNDIFKRFDDSGKIWMEIVIKGQANGIDVPLGGGICNKKLEIMEIFEVGLPNN
ncbi:MAG: hypothetical protein PHD97_01280 [Bacteroidales bacterium]|nr:hypothetical protein [Bacteroidales bacterium]